MTTFKRILLSLLLLPVAASADFVTWTLTFTNTTANGDSATVAGTSAKFTNTPLNNVSWITSGSSNVSATNFFLWMGANRTAYNARLTSSNVVVFRGIDIASSISGVFGSLVASTNANTNSLNLIPWDNLSSTNRTNNANEFIYGLNKYTSSNLFSEGSIPLGNYVSLIATQTIKNKILTNSTIVGGSVSNTILTNIARANIGQATLTNATIHGGSATNLTLTRATGSLVGIAESNVIAQAWMGTNPTVAGLVNFVEDGSGAYPGINFNSTWGLSVDPSSGSLILENVDNGEIPFLISTGPGIGTIFTQPITVSNSITATGTITAASATFPGGVYATNTTFGSGTNLWLGDLSVTPRVYTSLVNGDNYNLPFGTNAAVYASGATTVMKLHSLPAGRSYQRLRVRLSGAVTNWIVNESGGEGTATERVTTATGGDIFSTNQPSWAELEYTGSRWEVVSFR